jgi:hypothetical protein
MQRGHGRGSGEGGDIWLVTDVIVHVNIAVIICDADAIISSEIQIERRIAVVPDKILLARNLDVQFTQYVVLRAADYTSISANFDASVILFVRVHIIQIETKVQAKVNIIHGIKSELLLIKVSVLDAILQELTALKIIL